MQGGAACREKSLSNQGNVTFGADQHSVLVGLVGKGIQKSRTPALHIAEGTAQGLAYDYKLLDVDLMPHKPALAEIIAEAEQLGFAGLNITYPFKIEAVGLLDEVSDAVATVGAANTIVLRGGQRFGHNTDLWGFAENFRQNMNDVPRANVLLLGAGGAGAAVAHALIECGVEKLWIADKDQSKAEYLASNVSECHGEGRAAPVQDIARTAAICDGLVNATPVGMASLPGLPIAEDLIRSEMWVSDIVYFPLETELLRVARSKGCRTLSGAGMAIFQAVRAFELFTGIKPNVARMEATFRAFDGEELA